MNEILTLQNSEKATFADEFLARFLAYGFGSMPKKDMEILIFHLLYHKSVFFNGKSNYEIANLLKITENKVKSLKTEACLKYQQIEHHEALKAIAQLFFEYQTTKPIVEGDFIQFVLEDPILRREFEHAAKELGYFVDFSFNREIINVKATVFLAIFVNNFKDVENKFVNAVKDVAKDDKEYGKTLSKTKSLNEKIESFLARHPNKISLVIGLLSIFNPVSF